MRDGMSHANDAAVADSAAASLDAGSVALLQTAEEVAPVSLARRRAWRWVFGVVYVIALSEAFMWILAPTPLFPRHVIATSYGVRGNEPNARYRHVSADVSVQFRINSRGIRADREIPYEKPPGLKRILVLGDSFGIGYEVNLEDTFTTRLESRLRAAGVECEVVNMSVSGFGNAEQLVQLRAEGLRYAPDLVLIAWNSTDLDDNVRSRLFALENGSLVPREVSYLPGIETKALLDRTIVYPWISEYSMLHAWLREATTVRVRSFLAWLRSGDVEQGAGADDADDLPVEDAPRKELTLLILDEIRATAAAAGAEMLILDIPLGDMSSAFPATDATGERFQVFSPAAALRSYPRDRVFHQRSHRHFTPLACRLIGDGLADVILEHQLLRGSAASSQPR